MSRRLVRARSLPLALALVLGVTGALAFSPVAQAAPPGYAADVLADAPTAYYRLGEPSGTDMFDSSGNGHDGGYVGAVTSGQPPAITVDTDNSTTFNGGQFGVETLLPAPAMAYTLEAWVRPDNGGNATILQLQGAGDLYRLGTVLGLNQSGTAVESGPGALPTGVWSHVAATWDSVFTKLYVNGVEVASSSTANTPPAANGTLTIGAGSHTALVGGVDEVAYYRTALSPTAVADHYAIGHDSTPPVVTITTPAERGLYILHAVPAPVFSCTDPGGSGIRSCTPSSYPQYLGPRELSVTGIDRAGNETTTTHGYTVVPNKYQDEILLSSPIAYYRLNDPVGATQMTDVSGHHRHATYKNAVAPGSHEPAAIACERRPDRPRVCEPANDPEDSATHVGGNGYGYLNGLAAPTTAYTLEAWIKPDSGADGSIVGQGGAGQLYISGGHLALRQTQDTVVGGGPVLTPGTWWHVAATWNGTHTRLYVNGVEVGSSSTARKAPSGSATVYVGNGEMAPPFEGDLDEVAYYATALSTNVLREHYDVATAYDWPSLTPMPPATTNTGLPSGVITTPAVDALYAPAKLPTSDFACTDPDGPADLVTCSATVDGNAIGDGVTLPHGPGAHVFEITATDSAGNTDVHSVTYTVMPFDQIYLADSPLAYYRLDDTTEVMTDSGPHHVDGLYKNNQESGPVGISGDDNQSRRFWGDSGYGYAAVDAAPYQATIEAWVNADDGRDQSVAGLAGSDELFIRGDRYVYRHLDRTVTATVGPTIGSFNQVVGVWDGDTAKIYVDGVLRGTTGAATGTSYGAGTFYVGYGIREPWFKGVLDEVVYYDRALSPERVFQHYLADPPPDLSAAASATPAAAPTPQAEEPSPSAAPLAAGPIETWTCRVPELRGLRLGAARKALADAGCRLGVVKQRDVVAKRKHGRILVQGIPAGRDVAYGRTVRVTLGR
jgi:concanavalin A-like lectin/glucanase superfamily protein/PASTA domain-containing protein